jgi:hypothetical protein
LALPFAVAACGDDDDADDAVEVTDDVTDEGTDEVTDDEPDADAEAALPDPCEFAPAEVVTDAIGITVEAGGASGTGDFSGILTSTCTYRGTTGDDLFVNVQVLGGFDDPSEVEEEFSLLSNVEPADIEGLPDSTFVTDVEGNVNIFVVDAAQAYGVSVQRRTTADVGGGEDEPELAQALALALYQPA